MYCLNVLSDWFEYTPVCPEMGIGLPTPRPPIHLVRVGDDIRVKKVDDHSLDVTDELRDYAHKTLPEINDACGYIVILLAVGWSELRFIMRTATLQVNHFVVSILMKL